jgi:hypothetical protein
MRVTRVQSELELTFAALIISIVVAADACKPANSDESKASVPHSTGDTITPPPGVAHGSVPVPPTLSFDSPTVEVSVTSAGPMQLHESTEYGKDSVFGSLHVTDDAAYFQDGNRRIRLILDNPVTATGTKKLMADAAGALRALAGKSVWAKGELRGDIIWGADIKAAAH